MPKKICKAQEILSEFVGERAERVNGYRFAVEAANALRDALTVEFGAKRAEEIAFNLADWNSDAAFIVALTLFPERFTNEEIRREAINLVIHVPNHVARAARLCGYAVSDIFSEPDEE